MAHRLLPFRQYDENDVVNLFALDADSLTKSLQNMKPGEDGINADGVLVQVTGGNLGDAIDVSADSRFMESYSSPVGRNPYPTNPLKVAPCEAGNKPLGVTFRQTLSSDENGESLLFNPVKKDELNAVLSGQTVPVLKKGLISLHQDAFTAVPAQGAYLKPAAGGKFQAGTSNNNCGQVLATGFRGDTASSSEPTTDSLSGLYAIVSLDC
jgi:hypothetical protein